MTLPASERKILFIRFNDFFISCEKLKNKALAGKPVVVLDSRNAGAVIACSREARENGIYEGLTAAHAKQLLPEAIFLKRTEQDYRHVSDSITEVLCDHAPVLEKAGAGAFFIDLSNHSHEIDGIEWAKSLHEIVAKESGFSFSFALAANKMVARIATSQTSAASYTEIKPEKAQSFLDDQNVGQLPAVTEKTAQILSGKGIRKIGVLRQLPKPMLESLFGKAGTLIWKQANGTDETPVIAYSPPGSVISETDITADAGRRADIKKKLAALAKQAAKQLQTEKKLTGCIALKLGYGKLKTETRYLDISYTSDPEVLEKQCCQLFDKLFRKNSTPEKIGIRLSDTIYSGYSQLTLFGNAAQSTSIFAPGIPAAITQNNVVLRRILAAENQAPGYGSFLRY